MKEKRLDYNDRFNFTIHDVTTYNQFRNILRLFDVLPKFPFTRSEMMGDYYL